jgi:hypothetical protein
MSTCKRYVANIFATENIGDSLVKLNNNFINLKTVLCDLHHKVDNNVVVRTFFYYGPNAATVSGGSLTSNVNDNNASIPSNTTIANFVNNQLNLQNISKSRDQVYVIYQKTGYYLQQAIRETSGSVVVQPPPNTNVTDSNGQPVITTWNEPQTVTWTTTTPEKNTFYSPVFVIWRLIYNGTSYVTDLGFPKFSSANTASTDNWNNPSSWSQY